MKTDLRLVVLRPFRGRFDGRIFRWVFIGMMVATAIYVSRQTRLYEARGELEIPENKIRDIGDVSDTHITCGVDMKTVQEVLGSNKMLQLVITRLSDEDRSAFFAPYGLADHSDAEFTRLISANRTFRVVPEALRLEMRYRHPDRHMAARIVDLFLSEGVACEARVRMDQEAYAFQYLQQRAEQSRQHVEVCERAVVAYRESHPELKDAELGKDKKYQELVEKAEFGANLHKQILARLSETQALNNNAASGWRISQAPTTPGEDDYLLAPLVVTAAWGSVIAVITAVLAAVLFKRGARQLGVVLPENNR